MFSACKESLMSDSLGLLDFAIGLAEFFLINLSDVFWGYSNYGSNYYEANCLKLITDKFMSNISCFFTAADLTKENYHTYYYTELIN